MNVKRFITAAAAFACAASLSFGWSEQGGMSLSVQKADAATRLVVRPHYHGPYMADTATLPWYAVRAVLQRRTMDVPLQRLERLRRRQWHWLRAGYDDQGRR